MLTLGEARVTKIMDLDPFVLLFDVLLPDGDIEAISGERALLAPDHVDFEARTLLLGVHSFLLQIGGLNILIDSCVGEHKPRPRRAEWDNRQNSGYLQRLAQAGLSPADIDIVMCTHLHADHAGWNTRLENGRWVPTFPNARYVMGRKELDHWQAEERRVPGQQNHSVFSDSVLPVIEAGLTEPVDDGFELLRGLEIVPLHGHTPGQIGLDLAYGSDEHAVFCGDAIHSPVQVFQPQWSSAFCSDPEMSARTRHALLQRSADEGTLLLPAHFRGVFGMRAQRTNGGFRPDMV